MRDASAPADEAAAPWSLAAQLVLSVLMSSLSLWTLVGNGLVLAALLKFKVLRSAPNLLIGNLATSDFLLALTVLPLSSVNAVLGHWKFGTVVCNLWLSLDVLYCTASVWSLVAIAFDRFTATVFPLWYREKRQRCRAGLYSVLVWLLSSLICLPPLIGWDGRQFVDPAVKLGRSLVPLGNATSGLAVCDLFKETNYVVYSATGSFILPLVILVVLYSRIFFVLQRRARCLRQNRRLLLMAGQRMRQGASTVSRVWFDRDLELATVVGMRYANDEEQDANDGGDNDVECGNADENCVMENPSALPPPSTAAAAAAAATAAIITADENDETQAQMALSTRTNLQRQRADLREQRATQRMLVIVVVFIVCWMPFTLMYLIRGVTSQEGAAPEQPVMEVVQTLAIWLGYGNSALNPVLYTVFNRDFRHAIKQMLKCRRRSHNSNR